ncbi:hypothetical protein M426DRAFT_11751 [Hypoxylon sp. CI-4A]|nr:hypothetical protein M426DRAFT_11751 [Hypoxylon sp. CI-4A]
MRFVVNLVALFAALAVAAPGDFLAGQSLQARQDCCEDPPGCGCTDNCCGNIQDPTLCCPS